MTSFPRSSQRRTAELEFVARTRGTATRLLKARMLRVSESAAIIKRVLAESRCAVCGGALLYQGRPQHFVCVSSDAHDADPRFDRMVALARFRKLSDRAKRERLLFLTRFGRLISREDGGWRPTRP